MSKVLFVNGTLMRGLALCKNLQDAEFLGTFRTAPRYRIFSINDVHPGMYEVAEGGVSVAGELYRMSDETWQKVKAGEPPGLYCGPVVLEDGRTVDGILFPRDRITPEHIDISVFGGWRAYTESRHSPS